MALAAQGGSRARADGSAWSAQIKARLTGSMALSRAGGNTTYIFVVATGVKVVDILAPSRTPHFPFLYSPTWSVRCWIYCGRETVFTNLGNEPVVFFVEAEVNLEEWHTMEGANNLNMKAWCKRSWALLKTGAKGRETGQSGSIYPCTEVEQVQATKPGQRISAGNQTWSKNKWLHMQKLFQLTTADSGLSRLLIIFFSCKKIQSRSRYDISRADVSSCRSSSARPLIVW